MNERIRSLMARLPKEVDAVLIGSKVNRRYYTGMNATAGVLFATRDEAFFIIDSRYIEAAKREVKGCEVMLQRTLSNQLNGLAALHNVRKIGIESGYLTVAEYLAYREMFTNAELIFDNSVNNIILDQRSYKSAAEVKLMQEAQDIADKSFLELLNFLRPGVTERQAANELVRLMKEFGGEGESFRTIAVSGANSSLPHGTPTDKPLEEGDFFTLDFGTVRDGYCSDMTRTVAIGHVTDEQRRVYDTVLKAQLAALAAAGPNIECSKIDAAARDVITEAGYGDCFGHGLGHSIGLEVHEQPRFSPTDHSLTSPGILMSVEPGVYLEGRFGVRIEDVICITGEGALNLAHAPKELMIL